MSLAVNVGFLCVIRIFSAQSEMYSGHSRANGVAQGLPLPDRDEGCRQATLSHRYRVTPGYMFRPCPALLFDLDAIPRGKPIAPCWR